MDGQVVDSPGQPPGDFVDQGHGVVGEQSVGTAGQFQVMGYIVGGVGLSSAGEGITQGDPLVEGGEGPEAQSLAQRGLAGQHEGKGVGRVHVRIGQKAQPFELVGAKRWASSTISTTLRPRSATSAAKASWAWGMSEQRWNRGTWPRWDTIEE